MLLYFAFYYKYMDKSKKISISRKGLPEIIFTRACCSLGIVIFHYFCHSNGNFKFLFKTANSNWGFMFVLKGSILKDGNQYSHHINVIKRMYS